jgi:hypothetical protein
VRGLTQCAGVRNLLSYGGWIGLKFVRKAKSFAALERWQTSYLPVYGTWAVVVVGALPIMFSFD